MIRPGEGDFYEGLPFRFHDGVPTATGDDLLGRETVKRDNNDFAPRISLAYRPSELWTVRAGFGVFYVQDIAEVRFDLSRNLGGRSQFTANSERPNSNLIDPWKFEGGTCSNWDGPCQGPTSILANNTNRRTPYLLQWIVNVQRQLGPNTVVEAGLYWEWRTQTGIVSRLEPACHSERAQPTPEAFCSALHFRLMARSILLTVTVIPHTMA